MIKNYLKTAWRNLWKSKGYSLINITGLAIGMAASLLIMLFVFYEQSFDNFHTKSIYRLHEVQKFEGMLSSQKVALTMFPMGPTMKSEFPEIKNFTRMSWRQKYPLTYGDKQVFLPQLFFVDSTFLQLFDFKLIQGDPETALQKPNSVLLTETSAKKIFGSEDAIGKTVTHYAGDTTSFVVTGILADVPQNSHIQFDGLLSFNTIYQPEWMDRWGGNWLDTYFELAPETDVAALEKKFDAYLKKYLAEEERWKQYKLFLLPLKEIHANATDIGLDYINYQKFDKNYTRIFFIIALIVLAIACINFMNLSTARSAERAKEVGVRKSIGAYRWQIGLQFISESTMLSLMALFIAVLLVESLLPAVNNLSQRSLQLPIFSTWWIPLSLLLGALLIGLLSGLYPAAYLSAFRPVKVLKGAVQTGRNKSLLRNMLVVTQFASAIFLTIATLFAVRQLNYMKGKDPGFNRDQVLTIPLDQVTSGKFDLIKQELLNSGVVTSVTGAQDILGSHMDQSGVEFKGQGPLRILSSTRLIVDPDYLSLYNIRLAYGRNFSTNPAANGREYIINETLARELLKDEPKGATMASLLDRHFGFDSLGTIVGIAKDFNFNSLHHQIETLFMFNQKDWGFSNISVKIKGERAKEAIAFIHSIWQRQFPDHPFEYQFLDEHFADVYRSDLQVSTIVGVLAGLAVVISCMGLFGLASYSAEKRFKEIGIRKVLGASVQQIVVMLSTDFMKYVLIASLFALPLSWIGIDKWLQSYAYHVEMSWWIFVMAVLMAFLISLITVSFQAIKAAITNPVESLRNE